MRKKQGGGRRVSFRPQFIIGQDLKKNFGLRSCPIVDSAAEVGRIFREIGFLDREIMVAGALDCKCRLLHCSLVAIGSVDRVALRIADVFQGVVRTGGSAVFLAHNHPSGSLEPSELDYQLTQDVAEAGLLLGVPLLDHVIIAANGFTSLFSPQMLQRWRKEQIVRIVGGSWRCMSCRQPNMSQQSVAACGDTESGFVCTPARCQRCRAFAWLRNDQPKRVRG